MQLREKELIKQNYRLAIVKSAEQRKIIIPPNSQVVIRGYADREIPYQSTCALLQSTKFSRIPSDLDIEPSVVMFRYKDKQEIPVNISNLTTRTVIVNPREILCELHPVSIIDTPHTCSIQPEEIAHLKDVKIPYDELDSVQQQKAMTLYIDKSYFP